MKVYVIKQSDLDRLMHNVSCRYIAMLINGNAEDHRRQAREQYGEIVKGWIDSVSREDDDQ